MKPILLSLFSISMIVSGCDDFEDESIDRCAGASAAQFDVNDELGREIAAEHAVRMAKIGCGYDAFYND